MIRRTLHTLAPILMVALLVFSAGCTSSEDEGPTGPGAPEEGLAFTSVAQSQVELESVDEGAFGDLDEGAEEVIRDQATFESFWRSLQGDSVRVPDIDFSEEIVLAAVLGRRPTAGYEAEIANVTKSTNPTAVSVFVTEIEPGPNCNVAQVETAPFHIVKMDQVSTDQIIFQDNGTETKECE